jgi:hypothetical protein
VRAPNPITHPLCSSDVTHIPLHLLCFIQSFLLASFLSSPTLQCSLFPCEYLCIFSVKFYIKCLEVLLIFLVKILFRVIYFILYKISHSRLILFCLQPIIIRIYLIIIQIIFNAVISNDHLRALVVRVPGYTTYMYCVSCEVRTECIYVM